MSYNSGKHHENFKKQHNSFSKAFFKISQTKPNMFAMETKAVFQNKSDSDKKQLSVKHCYLTTQKENSLLHSQKGLS